MPIEPIISGKIFVNCDVDGTLTDSQDDQFGEYNLRPYAKEAIINLHNTGKVHFGIWSCRSDAQMETAKAFLKEQGLYDYFEHFNGDFKELVELYEMPNRKSSADIYIDDRAMWGEVDWKDIYVKIMEMVNNL